eukprot:evm.model.scf_112.11 EVM.evm.TU.scf_112.11   scf_112:92390-93147(-)
MLPFTGLWFANGDDEARFGEAYTAGVLNCPDRFLRRLRLVALPLYSLALLVAGEGIWNGLLAALLSGLVIFIDACWQEWGVESTSVMRTELTVMKRAILGPIATILLRPAWGAGEAATRWWAWRWLGVGTGALAVAAGSLAMPLLAKHELPMQFLLVAGLASCVPSHACQAASQSGRTSQYIMATWRAVDDAVRVGSGASQPTPPVRACCCHLIAMIYAVVGFYIPTYLLWLLEYSFRFEFRKASVDTGGSH